MPIKLVPLGAGQDVGRSCIIATINNRNVMLDCGTHMGYQDERRFPDFSYITKDGDMNKLIDAVIISHFHLDHCGALPYFTEIIGYNGPIYMTAPTKAVAAILLEDMRKVAVERKGELGFFSSEDIINCMKKVITIDLHQTIDIGKGINVKCYYAGHVLGAAMFQVAVGAASLVYTGDFNMTPDRHLGAAWIDKCKPDVLITESTYATHIRDSKRSRERDFLNKVHECVAKGGKVLIPVFALGRAQELCILVESYWERMGLKVPVYFSAGLTERANEYYKLFIGWTNQKIKETFVDKNMFDMVHIQSFDMDFADEPGPQVLFASPGMLHAGTSLEVFKKWCGDPKNMIIMPGYCVAGTVGARVLAGEKHIQIDKNTRVEVNMSVENLSFSAHADAKGILQLIRMCEPRNVVLVHGDKHKMESLKKRVFQELHLPCFDPPNGGVLNVDTEGPIPVQISRDLTRTVMENAAEKVTQKMKKDHLFSEKDKQPSLNHNITHLPLDDLAELNPICCAPFSGILIPNDGDFPHLVSNNEVYSRLGKAMKSVEFSVRHHINLNKLCKYADIHLSNTKQYCTSLLTMKQNLNTQSGILKLMAAILQSRRLEWNVEFKEEEGYLDIEGIEIKMDGDTLNDIVIKWEDTFTSTADDLQNILDSILQIKS